MKFKIVFIVALFFVSITQISVAEESSFFSQKDKQKHMAGSALFATAITAYARNKGSSRTEAFFYGAGTTIALGFIKEALDGNNNSGTREWSDVGANVIGAVAAAATFAQFEWKF